MNTRIYLDYAATAPLHPQVLTALAEHYAADMCNASALYQEGRRARIALEEARESLAEVVDCAPQELYFCSGGTEAAGTLIEGIARGAQAKGGDWRARRHIICAAFEHHAVLDSTLALKRLGFKVELLLPNKEGRITAEALSAALRPDTLIVTTMLAQNEVGTVQDIKELSTLTHKVGALFVCDCVQAFGKIPLSLKDLGVDAAFFSAHKIGGPYGVGAFYLRSLAPFLPRQLGGGQERKQRSGTQDIPGALCFALAAKLQAAALEAGEGMRLAALKDKLLATLTQSSSRIRSTVPLAKGDTLNHLPGYLHLLVQGIESQTMVLKLDELGFAVSGGSACSASSLEPSHVLTAMGVSKDDAFGALRISLGRTTTQEDCEQFAKALLLLL